MGDQDTKTAEKIADVELGITLWWLKEQDSKMARILGPLSSHLHALGVPESGIEMWKHIAQRADGERLGEAQKIVVEAHSRHVGVGKLMAYRKAIVDGLEDMAALQAP